MAFTNLSTLLNRMNRFQIISTIEEQFKVRDLDEAIRNLRKEIQLPWTLQKGTLKVFDQVLEYPVAVDHDELAYLDRDGDNTGFRYEDRARFRFTSLQQFYEDLDYRNTIAEIWDGNTRFLGVKYKLINPQRTVLNNAETVSLFTASGDASAPVLDNVVFREGNGSIRFTVTNSTNSATMTNTLPTAVNDTSLATKFYFRFIFLPTVPTSLELRFGTNATNYYSSGALTTQFSGQAMKAGAWNTFAFDLNGATQVGTVTQSNLNFEAVVFTGAATGSTYRIDASYLNRWEILDYWYYSTRNVATVGLTTANQDFFINESANPIYSSDSQLVGGLEWADVVLYDAFLTLATDKANDDFYNKLKERRQRAWVAFAARYPSMRPLIVTQKYRFETDFGLEEDTIWWNS